MSVPISQMWAVASHVLGHKLRGQERYPLVLMLEPLLRCNLACAGCGKIQYPSHVLRDHLSVDACLRAADECPTPVVSIAGGEPLLHPEIDRIVEGLVARGRYIYLCTNALLLEEKLDRFEPTKYLSFSVHMDGLEHEHDESVCREGTYRAAEQAIRAALARGFRVTTNTTLFEGADPARTRAFFDEMMSLGVEGMMVSPGYAYEKAPDQSSFLARERTQALFRRLLHRGRGWRFNQSPLFLEFLAGSRAYECTPWGNPTYTVFGWQRPCYLLQEGYAESFEALLAETDWEAYGHASGNPKCANCMVHSGFEATAVDEAFSSLGGLARMARATLFGPRIEAPAPDDQRPDEATLRPVEAAGSARGRVMEAGEEGFRAAFEYRGNVRLSLRDGRSIDGFLSNVTPDHVDWWPEGEAVVRRLAREQVVKIELSGRDPASGRSFATWKARREREAPAAASV